MRADVNDDDIPAILRQELRNASRYTRMAMEAAGEAMIDAGLLDDDLQPVTDLSAAGVASGTCIGGTYDDMLPVHEQYVEKDGAPRVPPHLHVMFPHNIGGYTIQKQFGMMGPTSTVVTACATGSQAIGDGFHAVKYGKAPLMIAGSMESTKHPLFALGFEAMARTARIQRQSGSPAGHSMLIVPGSRSVKVLPSWYLRSWSTRQAAAPHLCEIAGYATSNDAYHDRPSLRA